MFQIFINWLYTLIGHTPPQFFYYVSTRMIFAAIATLAISIGLGPRVIRKLYELKTGQSIRVEDCPVLAELHQKKKETPTMGGVLLILSITIAVLLFADLKSSYTWLLLFVMLSVGLIGGLDDYLKLKKKNSKGLKPRYKFAMQVFVAFVVIIYLWIPCFQEMLPFTTIGGREFSSNGSTVISSQDLMRQIYFPGIKSPLILGGIIGMLISAFFSFFVITGASNAVNLTDGLDGLASGCLFMTSSVFALVAFMSNNMEFCKYLHLPYLEHSGEIAVFLFALAGATLGFLWYNGYPAQVFMGDTGSLSMGAVLGTSAVLLRKEFLLAIVGGIFVIEAVSVILQVASYKLRNKKRIFLCAPLHHHFEYKGWPETKVVIRFWIIGLILALVGVGLLKFQ